jgi:hypothetical protein
MDSERNCYVYLRCEIMLFSVQANGEMTAVTVTTRWVFLIKSVEFGKRACFDVMRSRSHVRVDRCCTAGGGGGGGGEVLGPKKARV